MKTPRRYLRKEIESGAHRLGEKADFLQKCNYLALSQHKTQGRLVWYAEVALPDVQKLMEAKKRSLKRKKTIDALELKLALVLKEYETLRSNYDVLEANNKKLLSNIEEDKVQERYPRSPKSYLNIMQERAVNGGNPLPLQGGLAGLEKK